MKTKKLANPIVVIAQALSDQSTVDVLEGCRRKDDAMVDAACVVGHEADRILRKNQGHTLPPDIADMLGI
jgi:hypothetical protein